MTEQPNRITKFWQELKRRKVVKVIIIYASTTFILLQLISILIEPLHLPPWVMTFFIVLLMVGFPIVIILSWIFDVTPEGIKVTKPVSGKEDETKIAETSKKKTLILNVIIAVLLVVVAILAYPKIFKSSKASNINPELEKSIAVLPFRNDSSDDENIHVINGLMETILNNLCKIKNLRVVSRTSVEKYRNNLKLISEIAEELNVNYIVEGSGQKNGNQILLTVQLIEAGTDKHLWSNQYIKGDSDIFNLQSEVAKTISDAIEAKITPEEAERINKAPTDNLIAYDYFLKGHEISWKYILGFTSDNAINDLEEAITYFEKALEHDNEFALAYAELALTYQRLSQYTKEESLQNQVSINADKALLYDPQLERGLIAKAWSSLNEENYELQLIYLKKAIQVNPNSYLALGSLALLYWRDLPDTELFLEYTLKALRLNAEASERVSKSAEFYYLSVAFRLSGFFNEAEIYINKSLEANPENIGAAIEKSQILTDLTGKYEQGEEILIGLLKKDSSNFEILRLLGIACYTMKDYSGAYKYYKMLFQNQQGIKNGLMAEYARFEIVLAKLGKINESVEYDDAFIAYANNAEKNQLYYYILNSAGIYSYKGDIKSSLKMMELLAKQNKFPYWHIRVLNDDPMFDNVRKLPEFKKIYSEKETNFRENHERIKASLEEKGLL